LAPYEPRASDKQNTDKAVFELKRLSRDFKIPIVGISSLNRENYNNKISMSAFKESGAIEYSSDVLISLQFEALGNSSGDNGAAATPESIDRLKRESIIRCSIILKKRAGKQTA
jgi:replicative DNA helicase